MKRLALCAVNLVLLTACATNSASSPPIGASVQPLESGRFHVTYRGTSKMSVPEVQDRALLKAADVTLQQGGAWFQVTARSGGSAPPTTPQFTFGFGGASFGRSSAIGVGGATTVGGGASFVANLEFLVGAGARPPTADVYDAADVHKTLGLRLGPGGE